MQLPQRVDTIICGGGTSGAVVAGLIAELSDQSVLVLESGPDFGPCDSGRWPDDLRDASALGTSCDAGYSSESSYPDRVVDFERARVIGGCSAHNGCAAIWGSRVDYDAWAAAGLTGWSADDLLPHFREANRRMRVKSYASDEVTPFQQAAIDAAVAWGVPRVEDLNDLDEAQGIAPSPVNIFNGIRWNTSFAYLDPVRSRPNLTIIGGALVERVEVTNGRATGVTVRTSDGTTHVTADRVVVCGGTYESPALLLRSGIGPADDLRSLGLPVVQDLPGVGANLHDHPSVSLRYNGTPELEERMRQFALAHWRPEEQSIAKIRTSMYPADTPGFDLHFYPVGGPDPSDPARWRWAFPIACMTPRSVGSVTLRSPDPSDRPFINHRYLSDAEGHDRAVLVDGVRIAREIVGSEPLRSLIGEELDPGPDAHDEASITRWVDATVAHYYHPVGTCAMGTAGNPKAVTDATAKVHGIDGLFVADCSIMPTIPRANTNIPAVVVGERVGRLLAASS